MSSALFSLFSAWVLAPPNSAAFGVLVRARSDLRVWHALFTSDSIHNSIFPRIDSGCGFCL
ncbi:hypothetical protein PSPO01_16286 [Paraphaeosphaeria sporulosa]